MSGYLDAIQSTTPIVLNDAYPVTPAPPNPWTPLGPQVVWKVDMLREGVGLLFVSVRIANNSPNPIPRVCVSLPLPPWAITNTNAASYGTVKPEGWQNAQRLRAFWFCGSGAGIGVIPDQHSEHRVIANLWPGTGRIHVWHDIKIGSGENKTLWMNITEGMADPTILLYPWHTPPSPVRYIGCAFPVAQANLADAPTASNPTGMKDGWGKMAMLAEDAIKAGVSGIQQWDQQGYVTPRYTPDMLGTNAGVQSHMTDFARDIRRFGGRVGYCCRPGASIAAARTGSIVRVTDPAPFLAQLRAVMAFGLTDLYADSFGRTNGNAGGVMFPAELSDREIARGIRRELTIAGVASPGFAELPTQETIEEMGGYLACQWTGSKWQYSGADWTGKKRGDIDDTTFRLMRLRWPDSHWTAQIFCPDGMVPDGLRKCYADHVVGLVQWWQAPSLKTALAEVVQNHVNPQTGGWK